MGKKGDQQSSYPPEIKLEAIRLHFEEGVPHRLIMIKLGITSDVIKAWVREYAARCFTKQLNFPNSKAGS